MIPLRIPANHPDAPVIQKWATDKENILNTHTKSIAQLQGLLQTLLANNPKLGKTG